MTVSDYIVQKFGSFGIQVSEADLADVALSGLSLEGQLTEANRSEVMRAIAGLIPQKLAGPESINENGFSISWNRDGLREYYSMLCKELGLDNQIGSYIEDASDIW